MVFILRNVSVMVQTSKLGFILANILKLLYSTVFFEGRRKIIHGLEVAFGVVANHTRRGELKDKYS